jgi:hypothetical protein
VLVGLHAVIDPTPTAGLIPVFEPFDVKNLYMNCPWLYAYEVIDQFGGNWTIEGWIADVRSRHEYLAELEDIARSRNMEPQEAFRGIGPSLVLAPSRQRYVSLIPDLENADRPLLFGVQF